MKGLGRLVQLGPMRVASARICLFSIHEAQRYLAAGLRKEISRLAKRTGLEENSGMKPMKQTMAKQWIFAMLLCGLLVLALPAADPVPFSDITPAQAAALIKEKGADPLFVIVDVRTAKEFSTCWIKGTLNIDIKAPDFKEKVEKLARNGVYLACCRGGGRSARAMNLMKEWGFKEVYNLGGGLLKWLEEKLALEFAPILSDPPLG